MKRILSFVFLIFIIFISSNVYASEIKTGTYKIVSALDNNKILTEENGNIVLGDANSSGVTTWDVYSNGVTYYIKSHDNNNYAIDLAGAKLVNKSNINLYKVNNTNAQRWNLNYIDSSYYYITSSLGNYNIDVDGGKTSNGTNIVLYKNNGTNAQKWKFIRTDESEKKLEDGTYIIKSKLNSSNVIDIAGGLTSNKTNVQMYSNNYTWAQVWNLKYNNGYYTITSYLDNNKSLDIAGGKYKNKNNIWIYNKNGTNAQKYIIDNNNDDSYSINTYDGLWTFDVAGGSTTSGTNIWLHSPNGTNAQSFTFEKINIDPIGTGYYVINSILGENMAIGVNNPVLFNGKNVDLRTNENHNNTKWYIKKIKGDIYSIASSENTKYFTNLKGGNTASGTNVELNTSNSDNSSKWCIRKNDDNTYTIINVKSGKVLDISGGKSTEGTNILAYNRNSTNAQKFKFTKTEASNYTMAYENGRYLIKSNVNNSMVLDISGAKKANGTNVQIYTSNSSSAQNWRLEYIGDGAYVIRSLINPNLVLTASGNNVVSSKYTKSNLQKWYFDKNNNVTTIISMASGKYLNIAGTPANKVNVSLSDTKQKTSEFVLTKSTSTIKYKGVDLSVYNTVTSWSNLAGQINFAIIRAGFAEEFILSDGTDKYQDKKYIEYVKKCEENNIPYALYFYSYANKVKATDMPSYNKTNIDSADKEAAHMLNLIKKTKNLGYSPTLSTKVFFDQEETGDIYNKVKKYYNETDSNNPKARKLLTSIINEFCNTMKNKGYKCGVYSSTNWLNNRINATDVVKNHSIWDAEWPGYTTYDKALPNKPSYNKTAYKIWQFTSSGSISGISGNVDLDIGYNIFE